jgi:hypothetical protein
MGVRGKDELNEYKTLPTVAAVSIVDKLLVDQEIVLKTGAEEMVVRNTTSRGFKKATKTRKDWHAQLKCQPICNK